MTTPFIMYQEKLKFIDPFCGIGGFRIAFEEACEENHIKSECVFSSNIDKYAQDSYEANFGERRFTPREILRLQGFPGWYEIVVSEVQANK